MTYLRRTVSDLDYLNQKSADGRIRISPQISLGDYKQHNDLAGGQFNTETIGTGAIAYENSAVGGTELQVTTTNDAAIRQSYQWHHYFAGKPQKIELTASYFHTQANVTKRMGYFSSSTTTPFSANIDGMFFENDGTTIRCRVVRNGTDVFNLAQASWNNQDKLGSYDPTDFNFYVIDFLYLGGAIINFSILTEYGLIKVASYQHINVDQNTFVKSPNQPVRYEIRSSGGAGVFNHICSDVATEGFYSPVGNINSWNNGAVTVSLPTAATRYALLGIQQKADRRNVVIDISNGSTIMGTSDDALVELYYGGTTVGTITWTPLTFSNMEAYNATQFGTPSDRVHSGGVLIDSFVLKSNGGQTKSLRTARTIGSYIDGTREPAFMCVTPLTSNASTTCAINWVEYL